LLLTPTGFGTEPEWAAAKGVITDREKNRLWHARNGRSSATVAKKPVSSHEVAELIELLNDRWQRVPALHNSSERNQFPTPAGP
jgi:hypothetical protein